jgi:hypothetical protein
MMQLRRRKTLSKVVCFCLFLFLVLYLSFKSTDGLLQVFDYVVLILLFYKLNVVFFSKHRLERNLMRRTVFAYFAAKPLVEWSTGDVVLFLKRNNVREDLINAFEVNRVSGKELFEKEAIICSYMHNNNDTNLNISPDLVIDALMRTQGYSVRK